MLDWRPVPSQAWPRLPSDPQGTSSIVALEASMAGLLRMSWGWHSDLAGSDSLSAGPSWTVRSRVGPEEEVLGRSFGGRDGLSSAVGGIQLPGLLSSQRPGALPAAFQARSILTLSTRHLQVAPGSRRRSAPRLTVHLTHPRDRGTRCCHTRPALSHVPVAQLPSPKSARSPSRLSRAQPRQTALLTASSLLS